MFRLTEDVYVTDRQLRVFRDTLQAKRDRLSGLGELAHAECIGDMWEDVVDELDRRAAHRENGQ